MIFKCLQGELSMKPSSRAISAFNSTYVHISQYCILIKYSISIDSKKWSIDLFIKI